MKKCAVHPGWDAEDCVWCGADRAESPGIEGDLRSSEYARMAQHVQPGITGIRTKGQYQRLLKRHKLTDDVTHKELARCVTDTGKRERVREEKIRAYINQMTPRLQEKAARLFRR